MLSIGSQAIGKQKQNIFFQAHYFAQPSFDYIE